MNRIILLTTLTVALLLAGLSLAADNTWATKENVAVDGYDVVGYFTDNLAMRGTAEHEVVHRGVKYRFASSEHQTLFAADPRKYLPQYGGWCAFAMAAKNTKFAPDPKTFKLHDGQLLLFYNGEMGNTVVFWNNDEVAMKKKADGNWKQMK